METCYGYRCLILLLTLYIGPSFGYSVSIGVGQGTFDAKSYRLGVSSNWDSVFREHCSWHVRGYWELSFNHIDSENATDVIALAGTLRVQQSKQNEPAAYLDFGIGPAYTNKIYVARRNLGIHFQFEDRLGIGMVFGRAKKYDLGYRFIHFSNGYLAHPNHGLNLHMLILGYNFS